jgi:type II secretory pathway component PulF
MPKYDYIAVNEAGQKMSGQAEGPNSAAVRDELRQSGWIVFSIQEVRVQAGGLTELDAASATQQLTFAARTGLPLPGALRAFADDSASPRVARCLQRVSLALEQGEPLEKVLLDPAWRVPPTIAKILGSRIPAEATGQLLIHAIQSASSLRVLRTKVLMLLSYPACLFLAICGLWICLAVYIGPVFSDMARSFSAIPSTTNRQLEWLRSFQSQLTWITGVVGLLAIFGAAALWYCLVPRSVRHRLWSYIPFIGSLYRLIALSDLAYTLAVLVQCQVPLPQALKSAAETSRDADLAEICHKVALRIESGERIETLISTESGLPAYFEQILRWAALGNDGIEPLKGLSQMLQQRSHLLAQSVIPMMEPVMLIASVLAILFYASSLLPPILRLVRLMSF